MAARSWRASSRAASILRSSPLSWTRLNPSSGSPAQRPRRLVGYIPLAHLAKLRHLFEGLLKRCDSGELQAVTGINLANAVQAVQDELAIIEAGLDEPKPPPGLLAENEYR